MDVAGRKLKEVQCQYKEKSQEFDRLYEAFTKTSQVNTTTISSNGLWLLHENNFVCQTRTRSLWIFLNG